MVRRVFEDAMHRQEVEDRPTDDDLRRWAGLSAADWPTPSQHLPRLKEQVSAFLVGRGFPAPEQLVFHRGRYWCERIEGERPNRGAPVSPGWAYARQNAKPLTPEREAADLFFSIVGVEHALSVGAPDQVFAHAVILGSAVNRFNLRRRHLKSVTKAQKVAGGAKNSAHKTNAQHVRRRNMIMECMAELVPTVGVDKAAARLESNGLGTHNGNRRTWYRYRKKV